MWRWTFVWCSRCEENIVNLGRRWIEHTDERLVCTHCKVIEHLAKLS
jgi:hypothetical protein